MNTQGFLQCSLICKHWFMRTPTALSSISPLEPPCTSQALSNYILQGLVEAYLEHTQLRIPPKTQGDPCTDIWISSMRFPSLQYSDKKMQQLQQPWTPFPVSSAQCWLHSLMSQFRKCSQEESWGNYVLTLSVFVFFFQGPHSISSSAEFNTCQ